jgi:hypothetical protein
MRRTVYKKPEIYIQSGGSRFYYGFVGAILIALAAALILLRPRADTDVKAIRRQIDIGLKAATEKDVPLGLSLIDESYTDNFGNTYEKAHRLAHERVDEVSDVRIKLQKIDIKIADNRAQATSTFEMRLLARIDDGMGNKIPIAGVLGNHSPFGRTWESVTVQWVKRGENWIVARVDVKSVQR